MTEGTKPSTRDALEPALRALELPALRSLALSLLSRLEGGARDAVVFSLEFAPSPVDAPTLEGRVPHMGQSDLLSALIAGLRGCDERAAGVVLGLARGDGAAELISLTFSEDDIVARPVPAPAQPPTRKGTTTRRLTRKVLAPRGRPFVLDPGDRFEISASETYPARIVTIEGRLAEGGGGIVYLARDTVGKPIVVKTGRTTGEPPPSLLTEREVLAPIDHPNLVRLLGSHEDEGGNVVLFFELLFPNPLLHLNEPRILERVTLRRAPGSRYLPPPPAIGLELVHDLLRGLEALHALKLVHNDVKLSNFLVAIDHASPEIDDRSYFQALQDGAFHGVLIDGGGIRSQDALGALNAGDENVPPIELTPLYAPPEALLGLPGDPQERPHHSAATDVYAAALVAFTTLTGYVPYQHLRKQVDAKDLGQVLDLKRAERRGDVGPIDLEHLRQARFQDSKFADLEKRGHEVCRSHFERDLASLLLHRVDPDPHKRGSATDMKWDLERFFSIRARPKTVLKTAAKIGQRGPRTYEQHLFLVLKGDPHARLTEAAGPELPPARAQRATPTKPTRNLGSLWGEEKVGS